MGKKSIFVAYVLLFVGGIVGIHLLYLRRDKQAFLYWCTFGGFFSIAVIRDFFLIPRYVREANIEPSQYATELVNKRQKSKVPPFSFLLFISQSTLSSYFCSLWLMAVPNEPIAGFSMKPLHYLAPLAASVGVWLIGDIGFRKANFWWCVVGAYLSLPLSFLFDVDMNSWCSFTSLSLYDCKGKSWRKSFSRPSTLRRVFNLSFGLFILTSIWASYFYFNAEIVDNSGVKVKFRDAVKNFFNSPMFTEFKKTLWVVYQDFWDNGFTSALNKFFDLIDPSGERKALKVLGLSRGASQEEISSKFKKLSKEWHPDKHKSPEMKKEAENRFMEIADAYEKLSKLKRERQRKNKIFDKDVNEEEKIEL